MSILSYLIWFSAISFIYFGFGCFFSKFIIREFKRYKLPKFRILTGALQLLGAIGLLIGYYCSPLILIAASIGLSLLMIAGFVVRLKIKDNFLQSSPSFMYAVINIIITIETYVLYF
ncbi:DoxX family protein [Tenacibaculum sp. SG-28]|uniref:DoxX family protein n=1 Tax=Tenacibaculum sp. SG-28 TaxID=754426 RepID=UPI000CF447C8|nr:DoxX family protein [Tenacibaculum sp. SG-28]PQJ23259.1 hypothetical protein BSU00_03325 [Tenacibaculum sp. SG-28]